MKEFTISEKHFIGDFTMLLRKYNVTLTENDDHDENGIWTHSEYGILSLDDPPQINLPLYRVYAWIVLYEKK